jgi:hypothetical protein
MTQLADDWAAVFAADYDFFGEPFLFQPIAYVGGRYVDDPERFGAGITAAISEAGQLFDPIGERNASGMSKGVAAQHAAATALIDLKAGSLPYSPRAKDRLVRVGTGAAYEVSGVMVDDFGRTVLRVMKLGAVI